MLQSINLSKLQRLRARKRGSIALEFGGFVLRTSLSKTAQPNINSRPPLRFLRQILKNFCKFCTRKMRIRSKRNRDFGRPFRLNFAFNLTKRFAFCRVNLRANLKFHLPKPISITLSKINLSSSWCVIISTPRCGKSRFRAVKSSFASALSSADVASSSSKNAGCAK